jgi:SAM-dependent methyltransferase
MRHMQSLPWQLKIAAKIVLARLPLPYRLWEKIGLFKQGWMERPDYALTIFRRHFDAACFARKAGNFVGLELGPGDSLGSALIARAFGASYTFLVDVEPCASTDLAVYRRMEAHLRQLGLHPPNLDHCRSMDDVAEACSAEYLTEGLASLRKIPYASVDFVWSQAVLPYVRRNEFLPTLQELRRIQRPDGIGSHCIPIRDIIGGKLNDLRFSKRVWESSFMANSRFYTNRLRYLELLQLFRLAGFEPEVVREIRWTTLPTPRSKMAKEFARLSEDDLQVSEFDVLLHWKISPSNAAAQRMAAQAGGN